MEEGICQSISEDIGDCISEHYSSIGVMNRIKSKFPNKSNIQQYADYFIRIDLAIIEELWSERNTHEQRLTELRRARQGGPSNGNGDKISTRAGVFDQPEFWDYGDRQTVWRVP